MSSCRGDIPAGEMRSSRGRRGREGEEWKRRGCNLDCKDHRHHNPTMPGSTLREHRRVGLVVDKYRPSPCAGAFTRCKLRICHKWDNENAGYSQGSPAPQLECLGCRSCAVEANAGRGGSTYSTCVLYIYIAPVQSRSLRDCGSGAVYVCLVRV